MRRWKRVALPALLLAPLLIGSKQDRTDWNNAPIRSFFVGSEHMLPTIPVNRIIVGARTAPEKIKRGDLLLFRVGDSIWVKRVIGLPGDSILMRDGILFLNGVIVRQSPLGEGPPTGWDKRPTSTRRFSEQLPGEAAPHEILDTGWDRYDNVAPVIVPPRAFYVLGDNRDNSVDSRAERGAFTAFGGPVAFDDVYGIVTAVTNLSRPPTPEPHAEPTVIGNRSTTIQAVEDKP